MAAGQLAAGLPCMRAGLPQAARAESWQAKARQSGSGPTEEVAYMREDEIFTSSEESSSDDDDRDEDFDSGGQVRVFASVLSLPTL